MERIPKGIYAPEFRAEAVKLVELEELSVDAAGKRQSGAESYQWLPMGSHLGEWITTKAYNRHIRKYFVGGA